MKPSDHEWIEAYLDDQLSLEKLQEFEEALKSSPELRQECALAKKLRGLIQTSQEGVEWQQENKLMEQIDSLQQGPTSDKVLSEIKALPSNRKQKAKTTLLWVLAAQAMIASFLLIYFSQNQSSKPELISLGHVKDHSGRCFIVRKKEKLSLTPNIELFHNDQVFVEEVGDMNFVYHDGSEVIFQKHSYAHLTQNPRGKAIHLFSGSIEGDIAKQPTNQPLRVLTEHSESIVLGTKIEINSSNLSTLLEVKEGSVHMKPRQGGEGLLVQASEYAVGKKNDHVSLHKVMDPLVTTDVITKDTPGHSVDIDVLLHGEEELYLIVNDGGDGINFDHAGWIEPKVYSAKGEELLSDRDWEYSSCGWASSRRNRGYLGNEVYVDGQLVDNLIATHSNSVIIYKLPPGAKRFTAKGAILRSGIEQRNSKSSVQFEVYTHLPQEKLKTISRRGNTI